MAKKRQGNSSQKRPGVRKFKGKNRSSPSSKTGTKKQNKSKRDRPAKKPIKKPNPPTPMVQKRKENGNSNSESIINREILETPGKKRVSFSSKLDDSGLSPTKKGKMRDLDLTNESVENSIIDESTPLKPILKKRKLGKKTEKSTVKSPKKKKIRLENGDGESEENAENTTDSKKKKKIPKMNGKENDDGAGKISHTGNGKVGDGKTELLSRKQRKEQLLELKAKRKPYLELAVKAKKLWEQIRSQRKRKSEDRQKHIDELYRLVEGKVKQLIYAHDTVRVIQCLMALKGNVELRTKLFDEVKDEIMLMSKSKYAKFFVIKMLKYGTPAQREYIMQCFHGKIAQLMKHAVAAEVVEYAYNEYANALQRSRMISEFYSPEFALWKVEEATSLDKILSKEPERKSAILQSIKEHIDDLSTKPVLKYSMAHRLIREFFNHCSEEDRKEVIDLLKERVIEMVHTKDGVLCGMKSIWYGTPKERKIIVRTLKSLVMKICMEEHGHLLLLAIFDAVDDTQLVQKVILKEITQHMDEIAKNKHGSKVLHYLLKPRCSLHFMKEIVKLLAEGDSSPYSKKDSASRHSELLSHMSPIFLQYVTENMKEMMTDNPMLVLAILENAIGDKTDAYDALCNGVLAEEFIPMNMDNLHAIERPQAHFALKRLIKHDKIVNARGEKSFSEAVVEKLSTDQLLSWMSCNKGAFLLVFMYETGIPSVKEKIEEVVKSTGGKKKLRQYTFPAAKILAQKVL